MNIEQGSNIDDIKAYMNKFEKVYLYGAGKYAKEVLNSLGELRRKISAVVVMSKNKNPDQLMDIPIIALENVSDNVARIGVILGVHDRTVSDIIFGLEKLGYVNVLLIKDILALRGNEGRVSLWNPTIEITAKIGCPVNCKYCPQSLLYSQYFMNDKRRSAEMSLEDFKKCVDKTPKNTIINFAGFVEPFLHEDATEMILYAHESGRKVSLLTTLVGLTEKKWQKIKNIPFCNVTLHTPDKDNYANIPITEEYIKVLDSMLDHKKENGTPFIDSANCQSEPSKEFLDIACGRICVDAAVLHDRGGNLKGDSLRGALLDIGSGEIYCAYSYPFNRWVLLPDGVVVLCCMDFGLQHPLGNLITDEYNDIKNGKAYQEILRGLQDETINILCRRCSEARRVTKYSPVIIRQTAINSLHNK